MRKIRAWARKRAMVVLGMLAGGVLAAYAANLSVDGDLILQGFLTANPTHVNKIAAAGAATGSAPSISVGGASSDTNSSLSVAGKGTGIVVLGQTICTITGTTPQTCNGQRGIVTTGTLTTAAATDATFTINNSSVATTSLVHCNVQAYSGTLVTNGYPIITTCVPGSGSIAVHITNTHSANALNGTVQIGFFVNN